MKENTVGLHRFSHFNQTLFLTQKWLLFPHIDDRFKKKKWRFDYNSQNSHSTASRRFKHAGSTFCARWYLPECTQLTVVQVFCIREPLAFALTVCQTLPEVMADQVAAMCEQLIKAVNVMMDAETSQIYRLEALKVASLWVAS